MPSLNWEAYVCDARPKYPLLITAKRYWVPGLEVDDPEALTLVFAHGTGHHKEHYEPTLEHLYEHALRGGGGGGRIREAWAIDAPNHGDAAVLNEEVLLWGYESVFDWQEYARSVHIFLAGLGTGVDVDFGQRKLVAIGHSMGAIAVMLAGTYVPTLKFRALILIDPMMLGPPPPSNRDRVGFLARGAQKRRDIWPSHADALAILQTRPAFQAWDARVLRIYAEQGLRALPTAAHPARTAGVTLKCTKAQEVACYADEAGGARAYNLLGHLCRTGTVHFVYGAVDDYLPRSVKDFVLLQTQGRHASVRRVEGAGHLVPQMQPRGLADAIWAALGSWPERESA